MLVISRYPNEVTIISVSYTNEKGEKVTEKLRLMSTLKGNKIRHCFDAPQIFQIAREDCKKHV